MLFNIVKYGAKLVVIVIGFISFKLQLIDLKTVFFLKVYLFIYYLLLLLLLLLLLF